MSAEYGFDRALTWALTPLHNDDAQGIIAPDGNAMFSPRACRLGRAFARNPTERGTRTCRHGTAIRAQTGSAESRGTNRPRALLVEVPVLGECDDWAQKLLAVHVLGHEAMHLAGVIDEAEADCLATQLDAFVTSSLGAGLSFARAIAREYWAYYYRSQDVRYRSPDCRDGGSLDLFRGRRGWPTPVAYPANLAQTIAAFRARARAD